MNNEQMIQHMLEMQDEFNKTVHPQWREQNFPFYRAVWTECAELMDHYGWKWWAKQGSDMEQAKLELVDIWCFGLSMILVEGVTAKDLARLQVRDREHRQWRPFLVEVEALAGQALAGQATICGTFRFSHFFGAIKALNMSLEDLYRLFVGKSALNQLRQENGYKEGEYIKQWCHGEDNTYLPDILRYYALDPLHWLYDNVLDELRDQYAQTVSLERPTSA